MSSFGAVGDHLAPTGSAEFPRTAMVMGDRNPLTRPERAIMSATTRTRSPLADLVLSSTPDEEPYRLVALGHVGSWRQPFTPQLVKPADLCTFTRRRRSLSDLKEAPQARQSLVDVEPGASTLQVAASMTSSGPDNVQTVRKASFEQTHKIISIAAKDPPVWSRKGPPFGLKRQDYTGLDPQTFALPYGVCRGSCCV